MATYKGIQGFGVETLASDPTEPGSVGQFFTILQAELLKQLNLVVHQLGLGHRVVQLIPTEEWTAPDVVINTLTTS
jgi:hypothetical protein